MESIAKEAGISKGTIYLYFKNKEELYIALMMPVLEELGEKLIEFENNVLKHRYSTCKKLMNDFFEVHWQTYQYDPDGIRIVQAFQQGDHFSAMSKKTLEKINTRARMNYQIGRRTLSHSIKLGILKEVDVIKLNDIIWATFIGVVQLEESKLRATEKDHLFDTLKYAFSLIFDGLGSD